MAKTRSQEPLDGEVLGPEIDPAAEERVRRGFWTTLRRAAGRIPFVDELVAAYYCALDKRTPMRVRAMLIAALAYFVLPIDAVPDLLLGIGFTDDLTVLLGVIGLVRAHIREEHRVAARQALSDDKKR